MAKELNAKVAREHHDHGYEAAMNVTETEIKRSSTVKNINRQTATVDELHTNKVKEPKWKTHLKRFTWLACYYAFGVYAYGSLEGWNAIDTCYYMTGALPHLRPGPFKPPVIFPSRPTHAGLRPGSGPLL